MTACRMVHLNCDGSGCVMVCDPGERTARETRKAARDFDWRHIDGHDLCDECAPKYLALKRRLELNERDGGD